MFYALNVVPVYSVAAAADFWILNLIEFWAGSNPMAMQDGETEQQPITMDGTTYLLTASNKGFSAIPLGAEESATAYLEFDAADQTWSYRDASQEVVLSKVKGLDAENIAVNELYADGEAHQVVVDGTRLEDRI